MITYDLLLCRKGNGPPLKVVPPFPEEGAPIFSAVVRPPRCGRDTPFLCWWPPLFWVKLLFGREDTFFPQKSLSLRACVVCPNTFLCPFFTLIRPLPHRNLFSCSRHFLEWTQPSFLPRHNIDELGILPLLVENLDLYPPFSVKVVNQVYPDLL